MQWGTAGRGAACSLARARPARAPHLATAALALLLSACHAGAIRMPWHHAAPPAPVPVHELIVSGAAAGAAFPQFWKRNTLVVDLSAARGSGAITLQPPAGFTWPVRLAFRVIPGAIGVLEVRAAQRVSFPIGARGAGPVDLELAPGTYTAQSARMTVTWSLASAP